MTIENFEDYLKKKGVKSCIYLALSKNLKKPITQSIASNAIKQVNKNSFVLLLARLYEVEKELNHFEKGVDEKDALRLTLLRSLFDESSPGRLAKKIPIESLLFLLK